MILHCYGYSEFLTNMFCGMFYSCTVVGVVGVGEQQLVPIYGLCLKINGLQVGEIGLDNCR